MMAGPQANKIIAEAEARHIWSLYGFSSPTELVLEDLALAMGVIVVEGPLDGAVARLVRKGDKGLIRVREDVPEPGRKRFGLAHELGHWVLHKGQSQVLACTEDDLYASYQGSNLEVEANYFAAGLLMPEELFATRIAGSRPSVDKIKSLAEEFGTSLTATAVRYVELRDDYCAVVISEAGKVRWWRASKDLREHFWLDSGRPLSQKTLAASIFRGESAPRKAQLVDADAWLTGETDLDQDEMYEQVLLLKRYRQVVSLLWLP
jgi:Zn-dependent peptidase ImmA (M78 family)